MSYAKNIASICILWYTESLDLSICLHENGGEFNGKDNWKCKK